MKIATLFVLLALVAVSTQEEKGGAGRDQPGDQEPTPTKKPTPTQKVTEKPADGGKEGGGGRGGSVTTKPDEGGKDGEGEIEGNVTTKKPDGGGKDGGGDREVKPTTKKPDGGGKGGGGDVEVKPTTKKPDGGGKEGGGDVEVKPTTKKPDGGGKGGGGDVEVKPTTKKPDGGGKGGGGDVEVKPTTKKPDGGGKGGGGDVEVKPTTKKPDGGGKGGDGDVEVKPTTKKPDGGGKDGGGDGEGKPTTKKPDRGGKPTTKMPDRGGKPTTKKSDGGGKDGGGGVKTTKSSSKGKTAAPPTKPPPVVKAEAAFVIAAQFTNELKDSGSAEFKQLAKDVEETTGTALRAEYKDKFKDAKVNGFKSGSVVADLSITFDQLITSASPSLDLSGLQDSIKTVIERDVTSIGGNPVTGVAVSNVVEYQATVAVASPTPPRSSNNQTQCFSCRSDTPETPDDPCVIQQDKTKHKMTTCGAGQMCAITGHFKSTDREEPIEFIRGCLASNQCPTLYKVFEECPDKMCVSCCDKDYCNDASGASTVVPRFVFLVISLVLGKVFCR